MDVRRLAAIDMYGAQGTLRRRRIILAEFLLGTLLGVVLGVWILAHGSGGLGDQLFAAWAVGVGLNYLPLTVYAFLLMRPGALDRELEGVDIRRELRRYSVLQLWVVVPLLLLVLAVQASVRRPGG